MKKVRKKNQRLLNLPSNRSAQMEIIGLVIIVILITLGMLFAAKFALEKEPAKKIFTRKGLAYSTMSAIMKTSVECQEADGIRYPQIEKDLLEDCAKNKDSLAFCEYNCRDNNNRPKDCCTFTQDIIKDLLSQTLGEWNKKYEFKSALVRSTVSGYGEILLVIKDEKGKQNTWGCSANKERDSSTPFPTQVEGVGLVQNELYVCD